MPGGVCGQGWGGWFRPCGRRAGPSAGRVAGLGAIRTVPMPAAMTLAPGRAGAGLRAAAVAPQAAMVRMACPMARCSAGWAGRAGRSGQAAGAAGQAAHAWLGCRWRAGLAARRRLGPVQRAQPRDMRPGACAPAAGAGHGGAPLPPWPGQRAAAAGRRVTGAGGGHQSQQGTHPSGHAATGTRRCCAPVARGCWGQRLPAPPGCRRSGAPGAPRAAWAGDRGLPLGQGCAGGWGMCSLAVSRC